MIILNFSGGLGNQLFQYAFGRALSLKYNVPLLIDKTFYKKNAGSKFILNKFNIKSEGYFKSFLSEKFKRFYTFAKIINIFSSTKVYYEKFFHFDKNIGKLNLKNKNYHFYGYWQSFKYFKNILAELNNDFNFHSYIKNRKLLLNKIENIQNISIHVRGGDYKSEPHYSLHGLLSAEYYNSAVNYLKKKKTINKIFLFTNDVKYARKLAKNFNFKYELISNLETNSSFEDFAFLRLSHNKIISNSTFAWWAAMLSKKKSIVICPINWFKDKKIKINDLFPNNWKKI